MIGQVRITPQEFASLFDDFGHGILSLKAALERVNVTVDENLIPEPLDEDVIVLDDNSDAWYREDEGWRSPANALARYSWEELIEEFGPLNVYKAVK